jgi:hypothetical protein
VIAKLYPEVEAHSGRRQDTILEKITLEGDLDHHNGKEIEDTNIIDNRVGLLRQITGLVGIMTGSTTKGATLEATDGGHLLHVDNL